MRKSNSACRTGFFADVLCGKGTLLEPFRSTRMCTCGLRTTRSFKETFLPHNESMRSPACTSSAAKRGSVPSGSRPRITNPFSRSSSSAAEKNGYADGNQENQEHFGSQHPSHVPQPFPFSLARFPSHFCPWS